MEMAIRRREQEVWQACDDLWALHGDTKVVTGDEIRDRLVALGKSRGSPNEIYKYRKTWLECRGLNKYPSATNKDDSDPITRAVRLVHEQLKGETDDRIEQLEQDFTQRLQEKDQEIARGKNALDAVMIEFTELQRQLTAKTQSALATDAQLAAEIEIRKAVEKELALNRAIYGQEKAAFETRIAELKSLFAQQIEQYEARERDLVKRSELKISEMNNHARSLGHEYSDRLMELKTALINQEVITQQAQTKLAQALKDIGHEKERSLSHAAHIINLEKETNNLALNLQAREAELACMREERLTWLKSARHADISLKRSEHTVVRLRAVVSRLSLSENSHVRA